MQILKTTSIIVLLLATVNLETTHFDELIMNSNEESLDRNNNNEHLILYEIDTPQHEIIPHGQLTVTATMYRPTRSETDNTPNVLADGTRINPRKASEYRYVALSRDLLKRWGGPFDFHDFILVERAGKHSGVWQVRDTMHSRWENRIDFLQSPTVKPFKYNKVQIRRLNHAQAWEDRIMKN